MTGSSVDLALSSPGQRLPPNRRLSSRVQREISLEKDVAAWRMILEQSRVNRQVWECEKSSIRFEGTRFKVQGTSDAADIF
jgi:hypothetical protein